MEIFRMKNQKIQEFQQKLDKIKKESKGLENRIEKNKNKLYILTSKKRELLKNLEEKEIFYCENCDVLYEKERLKLEIKKERVGDPDSGCYGGYSGSFYYTRYIKKFFLYYHCPTCKKTIKISS